MSILHRSIIYRNTTFYIISFYRIQENHISLLIFKRFTCIILIIHSVYGCSTKIYEISRNHAYSRTALQAFAIQYSPHGSYYAKRRLSSPGVSAPFMLSPQSCSIRMRSAFCLRCMQCILKRLKRAQRVAADVIAHAIIMSRFMQRTRRTR